MPPKKNRTSNKQQRLRRDDSKRLQQTEGSKADSEERENEVNHKWSTGRKNRQAAAEHKSKESEKSWKKKALSLEKKLVALKTKHRTFARQIGVLKANRRKTHVSPAGFSPKRRKNRDPNEDEREADIILLLKFQQLLSWRSMRRIRHAAAKVHRRVHSTGLGLSTEKDVGEALQRACKELLARGVMMVALVFLFFSERLHVH